MLSELALAQDNRPQEQPLTDHVPPLQAATSGHADVPDDELADRYGRTPSHLRRRTLLGIVTAAVIAVVVGVWVVWAGPGQTNNGLDTNDLGYKVHSNSETTVRSQISVNPGHPVKCSIEVLDKSYAIVGWKIVSLPASQQTTRSIETDVRTASRGVTGLIDKCWIP